MNWSRLGQTMRLPRRLPANWPGWRTALRGRRLAAATWVVAAVVAVVATAMLVLATPWLRQARQPLAGGHATSGVALSAPAPAEQALRGARGQAASAGGQSAGSTAAKEGAATGASGASGAQAGAGQAVPVPLPAVDRLIIKTGSLTLRVTDLIEAMQRTGEIVTSIPGAYVAASTTSYRAEGSAVAGRAPNGTAPVTAPSGASSGASSGVPIAPITPIVPPGPVPGQSATLMIKVPAGDFDRALARLRSLGTPLQEQVNTQEVTEEYVDLQAQVRNLEGVEQQYLRFLDRAQKIEEILPLQQRLTEVRGQIERLRGRMNLLQHRADLATMTVTFSLPPRSDSPWAGPEPRPIHTLRTALGQLGTTLQVVLDVVIYLGVYLLPLLPVALAIYLWRQSRRGAAPTPPTPPTPTTVTT